MSRSDTSNMWSSGRLDKKLKTDSWTLHSRNLQYFLEKSPTFKVSREKKIQNDI